MSKEHISSETRRLGGVRERERGVEKNRMSGGGGSKGNGFVATDGIPAAARKMVQSLKEIVNLPEQEIYFTLKECGMDPSEAVQRLLSQGSFGCKYRNNAKAWMTHIIFTEWLKWFDARMVGRHVLLIMDNCSVHIPAMQLPSVVTFRNTTVFYLPPNTMSKIQPCDAGIIQNFKAYYRRRFNRLLFQRLQDKVVDPEKIDVLQVIRLAIAAWTTNVKPETIQNCFRHCWIRTADADVAPIVEDALVDPDVIRDLEAQVHELRYRNLMDIRNLIDYPAELEMAYVPTEAEIVQDLSENLVPEDETEVDDSKEPTVVKAFEVLQCASLLEQFWMQQDVVDMETLTVIQKIKDKISMIRTSKLVQKPISQYFSKV